ncbi:MAG: cob(I)yrinic acid a,c-diamide adenosyltransferase [Dehalococcoidales bacterium]
MVSQEAHLTPEEAKEQKPLLDKGLVSILTGAGKGKTTSAIGTVIRAVGHGLRAYVVFFAKGEKFEHGEFNVLVNLPNVTMANFGRRGWIAKGQTTPEQREQAHQAIEAAHQAMLSGEYDLVVLDEINIAISAKLIEVDEIVRLIEEKPPNVELILTGRDADPRLVKMADLVSEILMIKHPFTKGVKARKGIDY